MKTRKYPERFERFWSQLPRDFPLGNKPKALKQFQDLKITDEDIDFLVQRYKEKVQHKVKLLNAGHFAPNPVHIERWLRDERHQDDFEQVHEFSKDSQRRSQYAEFFGGTEENMGKSLGDARSKQIGNGTSEQQYELILDEPTN